MKKTKLVLLFVIIILSSCMNDIEFEQNSSSSDKIVFYGQIYGDSSYGYHLYWKVKDADSSNYFLMFEIGEYGDFYKEYNLTENNKFRNYKIGDSFPIRITPTDTNIVSATSKDTSIVLSHENKMIFSLY